MWLPQTKALCTAKETINRVQRQPTKQKKNMCLIGVDVQALIYKEFQKLNSKNTANQKFLKKQ
jgi:hypothetical protein